MSAWCSSAKHENFNHITHFTHTLYCTTKTLKHQISLTSLTHFVALREHSNINTRTQVRCVQPNNLKLAAGAGSHWESFDGVKILGQLVRAGLMETIEIRKRGYPFRQSYVTLWETFQESGVLKMLKSEKQSEIMSKDEERDQCTLVMKYTLGEEGSKLWSQGKTMLFGKDSLMRTLDEWRQRQCADIIQGWTRFQILRAQTKELDQAVGGLQRLWRRELARRKARKAAAASASVALQAYVVFELFSC